MAKSIAGAVLVVLAVILINVYSTYGAEGVRGWFGAKLFNKAWSPPARNRRPHRTAQRAAA